MDSSIRSMGGDPESDLLPPLPYVRESADRHIHVSRRNAFVSPTGSGLHAFLLALTWAVLSVLLLWGCVTSAYLATIPSVSAVTFFFSAPLLTIVVITAYNVYPHGVRYVTTLNYTVIIRGHANPLPLPDCLNRLSRSATERLASLQYTIFPHAFVGSLRQLSNNTSLRLAETSTSVCDAGGRDACTLVGLSSADVAAVTHAIRDGKRQIIDGGRGPPPPPTPVPDVSPFPYRHTIPPRTNWVLLLLACIQAVLLFSTSAWVACVFPVPVLCVLSVLVRRAVDVDAVDLQHEGEGIILTTGDSRQFVPFQDVFPLSVLGRSPLVPLSQGLSRLPRADLVRVVLHKVDAVVVMPVSGVELLCQRALKLATTQQRVLGESHDSTQDYSTYPNNRPIHSTKKLITAVLGLYIVIAAVLSNLSLT